LSQCPSTFNGFQKLFSSYGCPAQVIRRLLPQVNIILLPQGYLESRVLRNSLTKIFWKAYNFGFRWSHRFAIIDEAHNFGPTVEVEVTTDQIARVLSIGAFSRVQTLQKLCQRRLGRVPRPSRTIPALIAEIDSFLKLKGIRHTLSTEDLDALQAVRTFLAHQGRYWVRNKQGFVQLDPHPQKIFKYVDQYFCRSILFSATFQYLKHYAHYYGLKRHRNVYHLHYVPTPTSRIRQLLVAALINPRVSSAQRNRTPSLLKWCAKTIKDIAVEIPDHTWVFVPSYEFLEELYPLVENQLSGTLPLFREPKKGQISFLSQLLSGPPSVVIAVYGGKFSEGVEVRDPKTGRSRVQVVILIGLPFPAPTPEYRLTFNLYLHWYRYLHFVKWTMIERHLYTQVRQCLGRAIRSEVDQATGLILDYRAFFHRHHLPNLRLFSSFDDLKGVLQRRFQRLRSIKEKK
jgi:Rad3-related DNA helicase